MSVLLLPPLSIDASATMVRLSGGVLQGLPLVDQLHEPTLDHAADENARMNCVFTSLASLSRKVGGHPEADGDAIKDGCANYGPTYTGGADASAVEADGCLDHRWGIHADTAHFPNRSVMVNSLRDYADHGHFAVVTIPSQWNGQLTQPGYNPDRPNFFTHACVYCGYFGDTHVLMNPWGGFLMYYSSADLAERLCFLRLYPVIPVNVPSSPPQGPAMIDFTKDASGVVVSAHDHDTPSLTLGEGLAQAVFDMGLGNQSILSGERKSGPVTVALLHNQTSPTAMLTWTDQNHATVVRSPDVAQAMYSAFQDLDKLRNAPPSPAPVDNSKAIADLKSVASNFESLHTEIGLAVENLSNTLLEVK